MTINLLKAGPKYILVTRINRSATSNAGLFVPRRGLEETCGAVVYDPGVKGAKHGIVEGDLLVVRPHCGHDFNIGAISLTALDIDNDEVFGIITGKGDLDQRAYW